MRSDAWHICYLRVLWVSYLFHRELCLNCVRVIFFPPRKMSKNCKTVAFAGSFIILFLIQDINVASALFAQKSSFGIPFIRQRYKSRGRNAMLLKRPAEKRVGEIYFHRIKKSNIRCVWEKRTGGITRLGMTFNQFQSITTCKATDNEKISNRFFSSTFSALFEKIFFMLLGSI